jgi:putative acetyltransferase
MSIRAECTNDNVAIRKVVRTAFGQPVEAVLVDQLRADGDSIISLVAVDHDQVIGHVLLSKMRAPFKALALAPVSVAPRWQRSGIGSALIREALSRARQESWDAVFVLGDPSFYGRFGFDPQLASEFSSSCAGPHFMVLPLSNCLPATSGYIEHAPAFAALR